LERALDDIVGTLSNTEAFEPSRAKRRFVVGSADYSLAALVAPIMRRLAAEAPGIALDVTAQEPLVTRLEQGELDMAFAVGTRERSGLASVRLLSDGFLCMVRNDHPKIRSRLTLEKYLEASHLLVAPTGTPGSIVDSRLAERGLTRRVAARVSSFLAVPTLVCETDLVNTGPARLARLWAERFPIRVFPPPVPLPTFDISLLWHRRFDGDPGHAWMRALIQSCVKA
jgi:DNA-binding transcriptional LysR family regulator